MEKYKNNSLFTMAYSYNKTKGILNSEYTLRLNLLTTSTAKA